MGRYYHGDIEGKFMFAVQSSDDADFFGVVGQPPDTHLEYCFTDEDLPKIKKPHKPVAPQYRIKDAQGLKHEWSGRGRTPKAFEHYFNNGGSKNSCRI